MDRVVSLSTETSIYPNYPNYVQVLCITMGVMSSSLLHKKAADPVKLNVKDVFFLIK